MKMLISWNDKSEREGLFQPMKSQIDSYTMKWKNIVITSSASSAICDYIIDSVKLKHSYHFGKDTQ